MGTTFKIKGSVAVVVGAQYGSEGKGAIVHHIADKYNVHVRVGSPNAGHTFYWNGEKHVQRSIPCGWTNPEALIIIGRGALINMDQLMAELTTIEGYYPDFRQRLRIDSTAGVLSKRFHQQEGGVDGEMHKRIGSTGEGVGPARMARLERNPDTFQFFRDVVEEYGLKDCMVDDTPHLLHTLHGAGAKILIEGTQGSALSLLHSYWPYCTSTDTNAAQMLADVGIAPALLDEVILVARTYPIRVAGNSGPMRNEISWEELSERIGKKVSERTTVTKKVRRIAEWDRTLFNTACMLNKPTKLALTFADYVDPDLYAVDSIQRVVQSAPLGLFLQQSGIMDYIRNNECSLAFVGTGPDTVVNTQEVF